MNASKNLFNQEQGRAKKNKQFLPNSSTDANKTLDKIGNTTELHTQIRVSKVKWWNVMVKQHYLHNLHTMASLR